MDIFTIFLYIHITGGALSLISGSIVLMARKGDRFHIRVGRIYYYTMLIAVTAAIPMCFLHPNYFLFIISIFSGYMVLSGQRYIRIKTIDDVKPIDKILAYTILIFGLIFLGLGGYHLYQSKLFGIIFLVFGTICVSFYFQDFKNFSGKSKFANLGLMSHIQRMIGGYTSSITAFIVVNNKILPGVIAWLLPTVILVPLIIYWSRKYEKKRIV